MHSKLLLAAALLASTALASVSANADTISIGLQQAGTNDGAITTVATGSGFAAYGGGAYGTFTVNQALAQDTNVIGLPALLHSSALNTSSSSAGTLTVYITAQGLTGIAALANLTSSFTVNSLPAGWSVTESTYLSLANGLYDISGPLASSSFTAIGTTVTPSQRTLDNEYSVTEVYRITAAGAGNSNLTINLDGTAVPEPVSLSLLGAGLAGVGVLRLRRKA